MFYVLKIITQQSSLSSWQECCFMLTLYIAICSSSGILNESQIHLLYYQLLNLAICWILKGSDWATV